MLHKPDRTGQRIIDSLVVRQVQFRAASCVARGQSAAAVDEPIATENSEPKRTVGIGTQSLHLVTFAALGALGNPVHPDKIARIRCALARRIVRG